MQFSRELMAYVYPFLNSKEKIELSNLPVKLIEREGERAIIKDGVVDDPIPHDSDDFRVRINNKIAKGAAVKIEGLMIDVKLKGYVK